MKKILIRTRAAVIVLGLMVAAGVASATQVSGCQQLIDELIATSQTAQITGKKAAKDLSGLTMTLDAATATLAAGKPCDAIKKLEDFKIKVDQLVAAERFETGDPMPGQLIAQADSAIACIAGEAMTGGSSCSF